MINSGVKRIDYCSGAAQDFDRQVRMSRPASRCLLRGPAAATTRAG